MLGMCCVCTMFVACAASSWVVFVFGVTVNHVLTCGLHTLLHRLTVFLVHRASFIFHAVHGAANECGQGSAA